MIAIWLWIVDGLALLFGAVVLLLLGGPAWAAQYLGAIGGLIVLCAVVAAYALEQAKLRRQLSE